MKDKSKSKNKDYRLIIDVVAVNESKICEFLFNLIYFNLF